MLHKILKDKCIDLIERTFVRENSLHMACYKKYALFSLMTINNILCGLVKTFVQSFRFFLIISLSLFGLLLHYTNGLLVYLWGYNVPPPHPFPSPTPSNTPPHPLLHTHTHTHTHTQTTADLILFYYERGFMMSLSHENQTNIFEAFNLISWYEYLDDFLNIDNIWTNDWGNLSKEKTKVNQS